MDARPAAPRRAVRNAGRRPAHGRASRQGQFHRPRWSIGLALGGLGFLLAALFVLLLDHHARPGSGMFLMLLGVTMQSWIERLRLAAVRDWMSS